MATKFWDSTSASSWATAGNWSDGVAPLSGDTLYLNHLGTGSITSGLATGIGSGAGAESLTMYIEQGWTGSLGSIAAGIATYLTFSATLETLTVHIGQQSGQGSGSGSPQILIDSTNVTAATLHLYDSCSSGTEVYYPPIMLKGAWTIIQYGGNYGLAVRPGETGTLTAGSIVPDGDANVQPQATFGAGATITRLDAATGVILNRSSNAIAALNLSGNPEYTYEGSGQHTAASILGTAQVLDKGTGAWPTFTLGGKYIRRGTSAITVGGTSATFNAGATYDIANGKTGTTTTSNKAFNGCGLGKGLTVITNPGENW